MVVVVDRGLTVETLPMVQWIVWLEVLGVMQPCTRQAQQDEWEDALRTHYALSYEELVKGVINGV